MKNKGLTTQHSIMFSVIYLRTGRKAIIRPKIKNYYLLMTARPSPSVILRRG